jgi:hypothetical protein
MGNVQNKTGAEGANLARRNQMKLSGKRTLSKIKLWKVRSLQLNCGRNDTDGESLVTQFGSSIVR